MELHGTLRPLDFLYIVTVMGTVGYCCLFVLLLLCLFMFMYIFIRDGILFEGVQCLREFFFQMVWKVSKFEDVRVIKM